MKVFRQDKGRIFANINEQIRATQVRVVDENGENLGVLSTQEAISIARERNLDLIEVAAKANPPVARIYSFSKYKYEQDKKKKDNKGKASELKEMWFKPFIDKGDLDHKLKKVREFLTKKHQVKLTVRSKGRVTREHNLELINSIVTMLSDLAETEGSAKSEGRNLTIIVKPIKHKSHEKEDTQSDSEKI